MRKNQGTKIDPRCKRCGELKKSDPLAQGKHRRNVSKATAQYCTVAKQDYEPGYPKHGYEEHAAGPTISSASSAISGATTATTSAAAQAQPAKHHRPTAAPPLQPPLQGRTVLALPPYVYPPAMALPQPSLLSQTVLALPPYVYPPAMPQPQPSPLPRPQRPFPPYFLPLRPAQRPAQPPQAGLPSGLPRMGPQPQPRGVTQHSGSTFWAAPGIYPRGQPLTAATFLARLLLGD